jgi:hypothetical protein
VDHVLTSKLHSGLVFGLTPEKVLSFGKDPYSQTRYIFTT